MPRAVTGGTKSYQVKRRNPNGSIYVYQRTEKYDPETKRMVKVGKDILVGKILPGDPSGIILPTRPKKKPEVESPRDMSGSSSQAMPENVGPSSATRVRYRGKDILDAVARKTGIDEDIEEILDIGDAQKLLSCARFLTCTSNATLSHIVTWQFDHPIPYAEGMSKDICQRLTAELGQNETFRQKLFARRISRITSDVLIAAYDSTTVSTYSEKQNEARYGFNKEKNGLKTIKLLALYDSETNNPLSFVKQPGNIPDVVSVTNALSQLSVLTTRNVILVADNGFYSDPNGYDLITGGFSFLMKVEHSTRWIRDRLNEHYDQVLNSQMGCSESGAVVGYSVNTHHIFSKTLDDGTVCNVRKFCHIHFYVDTEKRNSTMSDLRTRLRTLLLQLESGVPMNALCKEDREDAQRFIQSRVVRKKIKYRIDNDAVAEECKYTGIFTLIGCGPCKQVRDTRAAYSTYLRREHIEDHFRAEKQTVDGDTVRSWYGPNYMGRLTIQFVGLIYEECLWNEMNRIKEELERAIQQSNLTGKRKTLAKVQQKLLTWLRRQTVSSLIQWFDAEERVEVSSKIRSIRWNTETVEQDRLFLEMLGVISN